MLSAPLLERATTEDLAIIAAMRAAEGWTANRWLLDLVNEWDRGRFIVARPDAGTQSDSHDAAPRVIAATGAVAYGRLGFIGNVVVHPGYRRQGLAGHLMRAALEWLDSQGVRRVELDATVQGRPVYQQLGFVGTEPSWVLWAPVTTVDSKRLEALAGSFALGPLRADHVHDIAALDRAALGGDRLGLLRGVLSLADTAAYVAHDPSGAAVGYLVVRPVESPHGGLHLGPWVASTPAAGATLLLHALRTFERHTGDTGHNVPHLHATLPGRSHAAREFCAAIGLQLVVDDLRMRLDLEHSPATPESPDGATESSPNVATEQPTWVYAMLSTMVG